MMIGGLLLTREKWGRAVCEYLLEKKKTGVSNALAIGPAIDGIDIHLDGSQGRRDVTMREFSISSRLYIVGSMR